MLNYPPTGNVYFDLLPRLGETDFDSVEAEVREIDGIPGRVATAAALYTLKTSSGRLQDQAECGKAPRNGRI